MDSRRRDCGTQFLGHGPSPVQGGDQLVEIVGVERHPELLTLDILQISNPQLMDDDRSNRGEVVREDMADVAEHPDAATCPGSKLWTV